MTTTTEARCLVDLAVTGARPRLAIALMDYAKKVKANGSVRDSYTGPDPRAAMQRAADDVRTARLEVASCLNVDESAPIVFQTIQEWMSK